FVERRDAISTPADPTPSSPQARLRPSASWGGRFGRQHLTRSLALEHVRWPPPLRRDDEERSSAWAAEGASEAAAIKLDFLKHLTTFTDSHAALIGDICVPDGVLGVCTNTVGHAVSERGPHSAVREATVGIDAKRRQPLGVGLGDD